MEDREDRNASIKGPYTGKSIISRIEAFFLDNLGKIVTREQLREVATDPNTKRVPENWHQRVSELRTDKGYTILSWRNRGHLKQSEYMMPNAERRQTAAPRKRPTAKTWKQVLSNYDNRCAWTESGIRCSLKNGDIDHIGGGTVKLTPDHKTPHSLHPDTDPKDPTKWQPLCGRHQIMKKNYWDDDSGWLNVFAIVQAASEKQKREVYEFLKQYFGGELYLIVTFVI